MKLNFKKGVVYINIIVHHPINEADKAELLKCVAKIHADSVKKYIFSLSCPRQQKIKLLSEVQGNKITT